MDNPETLEWLGTQHTGQSQNTKTYKTKKMNITDSTNMGGEHGARERQVILPKYKYDSHWGCLRL